MNAKIGQSYTTNTTHVAIRDHEGNWVQACGIVRRGNRRALAFLWINPEATEVTCKRCQAQLWRLESE